MMFVSVLSLQHQLYQFQLTRLSLSRRLLREPYLDHVSHISLYDLVCSVIKHCRSKTKERRVSRGAPKG